MCVCACVCKYVLMGPLIKTLGVSAICQHWSIIQETDSSLCACVCAHVFVCFHLQAELSAQWSFYLSLRHITVVEIGSTHACIHIHFTSQKRCEECKVLDKFIHTPRKKQSALPGYYLMISNFFLSPKLGHSSYSYSYWDSWYLVCCGVMSYIVYRAHLARALLFSCHRLSC